MSPSSPPLAVAAPDRDLLDAYLAGNQEAFAELVTRHAAMVYASCRRQLGTSDADDATQATFLVLARRPQSAARAPALAAWLLRVARNVSANLRRGRQRRARAEQEAAMATRHPTSVETAPEPAALAHLDELLDSLPEHERRVVVLHVMQSVDQDEVARLLGCPPGTVRSRLSRGLARLRDALARRGVVLSLGALATMLASNAQAAPPPGLADSLARAPSQPWPADHAIARAAQEAERALAAPKAAATATLAIAGGLLAALALGLWWRPQAPAPVEHPSIPVTTRPPPDAAVWLPADPHMVARLNDWQRTRARLRASPYAPLLDRILADQGRGSFDATAMPSLHQVVVGARLKTDWTSAIAALVKDGATALPRVADFSAGLGTLGGAEVTAEVRGALGIDAPAGSDWRVERPWGTVTRRGGMILATDLPASDGTGLPRAHAALEPRAPDADLELTSNEGFEASPGRPMPHGLITVTIGEHGMRMVRSDTHRADEAPRWPVRPADLDLLRSLPADTLVGLVRSCSALTVRLPPQVGMTLRGMATSDDPHGLIDVQAGPHGGHAVVRIASNQAGAAAPIPPEEDLPRELVLDGDVLMYARAGTPFPSFTVAAAMDPEQGGRLTRAVATLAGGTLGEDGLARATLFRSIPLQAGWRDGRWIITTHPDGVAGHLARRRGFADDPDVATALAAVPREAYIACVARGQPTWTTLTSMLSGLSANAPEGVARTLRMLPDELARACRGHRELMYATADGADRRMVADGPLFGLLGLLLDLGEGALPLLASGG